MPEFPWFLFVPGFVWCGAGVIGVMYGEARVLWKAVRLGLFGMSAVVFGMQSQDFVTLVPVW